MLKRIILIILKLSPASKKWFWEKWYDIFAKKARNTNLRLMNYGYDAPDFELNLSEEDDIERYPIQLYHFVTSHIDIKDKNILDIKIVDLATKVEQDLLNTKNITEIVEMGFPTKEITINIRENDLLRYNTSFQEISMAISSKNNNITTGFIRGNLQEMSIRSNDRVLNPEDISKIILKTTRSGEIVSIGDVADVNLGYSEDSQESTFNGLPAVSFQIEKTVDQDIEDISKTLHDYQEKFNKENPEFQFDIYFEFNELLEGRIDLLTKNGLTGLVLVLVFLGLFLNVKLSSWVAFGIPFSFLGMFILGSFYGITINMISLFGMILVVGILVDDGIVIAENIYAHFEKGKSAKQAAIDGTMEVLPSVCSSVITTIVAFSVLFFVEGLEMSSTKMSL